jgi:hypothetical protein
MENLVGGLEHEWIMFHYFSIYWEISSSQLTFIFFRGVGIPPTRWKDTGPTDWLDTLYFNLLLSMV